MIGTERVCEHCFNQAVNTAPTKQSATESESRAEEMRLEIKLLRHALLSAYEREKNLRFWLAISMLIIFVGIISAFL